MSSKERGRRRRRNTKSGRDGKRGGGKGGEDVAIREKHQGPGRVEGGMPLKGWKQFLKWPFVKPTKKGAGDQGVGVESDQGKIIREKAEVIDSRASAADQLGSKKEFYLGSSWEVGWGERTYRDPAQIEK